MLFEMYVTYKVSKAVANEIEAALTYEQYSIPMMSDEQYDICCWNDAMRKHKKIIKKYDKMYKRRLAFLKIVSYITNTDIDYDLEMMKWDEGYQMMWKDFVRPSNKEVISLAVSTIKI